MPDLAVNLASGAWIPRSALCKDAPPLCPVSRLPPQVPFLRTPGRACFRVQLSRVLTFPRWMRCAWVGQDLWLKQLDIGLCGDAGRGHLLALFVEQIEEPGGLLADQVDTANIVRIVNVMPRDTFTLVLLLRGSGVSREHHYLMARFVFT